MRTTGAHEGDGRDTGVRVEIGNSHAGKGKDGNIKSRVAGSWEEDRRMCVGPQIMSTPNTHEWQRGKKKTPRGRMDKETDAKLRQ
jgi:hypothetical protein